MRITFKSFLLPAVMVGLCVAVSAQSGPWTYWTKKDAERVLNDSSWGQTFSEQPQGSVDTTVVTNTRGGMSGDRRGESGQPVASKSIHYRARLLTAKPVREAYARLILLQQKDSQEELVTQLQGFIDRDFGDYLVVSFSADSEDARRAQLIMAMLGKLNGEILKDRVYLERGDGKRAAFIDYKTPLADGMGGKFVFSRTLDGQPFLSEASDHLRFVLQLSENQKINLKFKTAGMAYSGKLEY